MVKAGCKHQKTVSSQACPQHPCKKSFERHQPSRVNKCQYKLIDRQCGLSVLPRDTAAAHARAGVVPDDPPLGEQTLTHCVTAAPNQKHSFKMRSGEKLKWSTSVNLNPLCPIKETL